MEGHAAQLTPLHFHEQFCPPVEVHAAAYATEKSRVQPVVLQILGKHSINSHVLRGKETADDTRGFKCFLVEDGFVLHGHTRQRLSALLGALCIQYFAALNLKGRF